MTGTITTELVQMTPQMAAQILQEQEALQLASPDVRQRRVDRHRVAQYAREMKSGSWMENGEPIQFNGARLLNGQHRLHAITQAGTAVPLLVVRGVSPEAFATMDQGKARTIRDLMGVEGLKYQTVAAGAARIVMIYEQFGDLRRTSEGRPSRQQVYEFMVSRLPDLEHAAALAMAAQIGSVTPLAALAYLGRFRTECAGFFEALRTGAHTADTDPVWVLRERLAARRGVNREGDTTFALCVKAWNAAITQKPVHQLRYAANEEFPSMIR